jgi:hypothetical protein
VPHRVQGRVGLQRRGRGGDTFVAGPLHPRFGDDAWKMDGIGSVEIVDLKMLKGQALTRWRCLTGFGHAVLVLGKHPEFVALLRLEPLHGQVAEAGPGALLPGAAGLALFHNVAAREGICT